MRTLSCFRSFRFRSFRIPLFAGLLCACLIGIVGAAGGSAYGAASDAAPDPDSASGLRAKYSELSAQLSNNPFKRPLYLESTESPNHLKGDIYAVLDYPFATVNQALNDPSHWCDVLILHLNTKYCHANMNGANGAGAVLAVSIGGKKWEELNQAYRVDFDYSAAASSADYLAIVLHAKQGPLGTSDYRIRLEAVSLEEGKTFLHLTYAYSYNFSGKVAMQGYLATVGSDKVGFTNTAPAGSAPVYIGGVRGVVERNTMRYYLAIDAYLGSLSTPPAAQLDKRLQEWFSATELYPRQLHEVDRADYLDMKQREYARQQTAP
jgi:hypothetical protein